MSRLTTTAIFMFMIVTSYAQDISREGADSLMKDSERPDSLLVIGEFEIGR